jgi:uncharacterized protein (DUF885 family)
MREDEPMEEPEPNPRGELSGERASARRFRRVAEGVVDALLESAPETATELGDHRFDDRLSDLSADGVATRADLLRDALQVLDGVDDHGLTTDDRVDREILRTCVAAELWRLEELREHEHDPLVHLPGDALYPLLARDVGEPATRALAVAARLAAVPHHLDVARERLTSMPRVHVETAIGQARGVAELLGADLEELLDRAPVVRAQVDAVRGPAAEALEAFARWLESRLPESDADPRLGEQRFAAKLWYTLDTETAPDVLLTRAESDLQGVEEEIAELASRIASAPPRAGQVREVLDRLAAQAPVTDASILPSCRTALQQVIARVRELDLVGVPDECVERVQIVVMPPARRGVAVAYCDPPGPLEPPGPDGVPLPSIFAVAPTPPGWTPERVASFYREYNGHMVRNLSVHEGVPGHVLQLASAARHRAGTRVRSAFWSGPFVEGWAVYAEELVAAAGLGGPEEDDDALRMQRLKMLLRSTINAILDVRVHARGMTEAEAMRLLTERGHQEDGEAAGKWRRALLTSAQLSTYYTGYHEVRGVVALLRAARPGASDRALHDEVLSHGSPPPRHLRTLLDLA